MRRLNSNITDVHQHLQTSISHILALTNYTISYDSRMDYGFINETIYVANDKKT